MSTINDGGPAFPVNGMQLPNDQVVYPFPGMTLRDYFAEKAMSAFLRDAKGVGNLPDENRKDVWLKVGALAYEQADAMLRAREGGAA